MMEEDLDKDSCVTVICLCPSKAGARPLAANREEPGASGREGACDAVTVA